VYVLLLVDFHAFYRPRRPLGWVGLQLYSFLRPLALDRGGRDRPHAPATSTPGKDPASIVQEAGWTSGPVWTGGKSRPQRDSTSDRPARSQSLYGLSYSALYVRVFTSKIPFVAIFVFASQQLVLLIWMFFLFLIFLQLNTQSKFSIKLLQPLPIS
jgi:hypothetical protein